MSFLVRVSFAKSAGDVFLSSPKEPKLDTIC